MNKLNYKPEELGVDAARSKTKDASSQLLEMIGVKGKVTEPGPGISRCDNDSDRNDLYLVRHPWSVYDVSNDDLQRGMENLRVALPEKGWKILKDGVANSKDQDPEIYAENKELHYAAHFTWMRNNSSGQPMINVSVVSSCFRAPAGTDLSREY
ncbi:hypothetical protein ACFY2W_32615 [Streptomyces sp. NPDC001262]|uniref:hypothetical protein n=1 Tax=unclassified Streptomyces TaxID=2593676 RepID=UPI0036A2EF2C